MKPFLFVLMAFAVASAAPLRAADTAFTPTQRQEVIKIVREAMKTDPSILRDAIAAVQADDEARQQTAFKAKVAGKQKMLVANPGDPVAGNPAGNITLVEFYDPRCPYCRRMLPSIDSMLKKDPALRLVYKDIPVLGPASVMESRAILAAQNQGAYLKMQAALMTNPAPPSEKMIRQTATALGLNADRLAADMSSAAVTRKIEANLVLAKDLQIQGTPIFVIGDQMIPGAVEQDQLEAVIAESRKR